MGSQVAGRAEWCAAIRVARGEDIWASAPVTISTWLLLEHPGPWPSHGLPDDLDDATVLVLKAAEERGVRVQLIRRVRDRRRPVREVILAGRGGERGWAERREIASLAELSTLDLDALGAGTAPGFGDGVDPGTPVVLVCTHGRRDVCCARLGRPVAVELDAALPGRCGRPRTSAGTGSRRTS
ncbi:sucraseferredoxin family protein [Microbacterium sp. HM58-2]|nr:sucraseferredoxin family protein [Microbacterium sp. HM58-2]